MSLFDPSKKSSDGTGGSFVSLKDGEFVVGVIAGDLVEYSCLGWGKTAQECEPGTPGATNKFKVNFVIVENGKLVAKILDRGMTIYEQLSELEQSGYDLHKTRIRLSRKGGGKNDTVYTITPLPNGALTDQQFAQIQQVGLLPLKKKTETQGFKDTGMAVDPKFTTDTIPW